jgi:TolA-binding protein
VLQIKHSILFLAVLLLTAGTVRAEATVDWLMDDALEEVYQPLAQADIITPRHMELALEQYRNGNYRYSASILERLQRLQLPDGRLDFVYFALGECYRQMKLNALSEQQYETVIRFYKSSEKTAPSYFRLLQYAYEDVNALRADSIMEIIKKTYSDHPLYFSSLYVRAKLMYSEERYNDVISMCAGIPSSSAIYYQSRFLTALAHIRTGNADKAIVLLEDINKNSGSTTLSQNAGVLLGDVYYSQKKYVDATLKYEAVPDSSKKYALVQVRVARTSLDMKRYDKARDVAERFIQMRSNSEYVFEMLSVLEQAYSAMNDDKNAERVKLQMASLLKKAESSFEVYDELNQSSLMINHWEIIGLSALQQHDTATWNEANANIFKLNALRQKFYALMEGQADTGKYTDEIASMAARRYLDMLTFTMKRVKDSVALVQKTVDSMFVVDSQQTTVNDSLLEARTGGMVSVLDSTKNRYAMLEREYAMVVKECIVSSQGRRKRDEEIKAKFVDWAFQQYLEKRALKNGTALPVATAKPSKNDTLKVAKADSTRSDTTTVQPVKDTLQSEKNNVAAAASNTSDTVSQQALSDMRAKLIADIAAMHYAYANKEAGSAVPKELSYDQANEANPVYYAPATLFRLAELYYDDASEAFDAQLRVYEKKIADGEKGLSFPEYDLTRVIETYNEIINEYPRDPVADDAVFYKALALQKTNKYDEAQQVLLNLIDQYPRSEYFVEATMNIARYYFEHPKIQGGKGYQLAQESYQKILAFPEHPQFVSALYGLGWCYYMMDEYDKTTDIFKYMIQTAKLDFTMTDSVDKKQIKNPLLRDEAVDCIAISFDEKRRLDDAVTFLSVANSVDYGATVIKRIAELREEDIDYVGAVGVYQRLIAEYPGSFLAPDGMLGMIKMYEMLKQPDSSQRVREDFLSRYIRGSQWQEAMRSRDSLVIPRIDSIVISMGLFMGDQYYRLAEANHDMASYAKSADYYRMIVNAYPDNKQAQDAQWNLALIYDTKLNNRSPDAYTEYIKLSRSKSADDDKREEAALNALAIAQKMLPPDDTLASNGKTQELPDQFVSAVNNYRELFPDGKHLSAVLFTVGPIYFNKKLYAQAAEYFELIVKKGPQFDDYDAALFLLAECQFGLQNWLEASKDFELVWKSTSPKARRADAYKLLLQSEFARAKQAFSANNFKEAAQIFLSIEDRYPNSEYGDAVLFKAAECYEQLQSLDNACNSYIRVAKSYPRSKLAPSALFNASNDYEKAEQFDKAAQTYEMLIALYPESDKIKDAMFNLGLCYEKANNPTKMAEANERYARMFPGEKDVEVMLLRTAEYYTKAKMEAKAVTIYQNFIRQFPKSLKTVDAYYFIGKTYLGWNDRENAYQNFNMAEQQNMKFVANGAPVGSYYAAEAAYSIGTMKREEFSAIKLELPEAKLNADQKAKAALLLDAVKAYERVVQYQGEKMFEAGYRIGQLYEDAAFAWQSQERASLDPIKAAVQEKEIMQTASILLQKTFTPYKKVLEIAIGFDSLTPEQKKWIDTSRASLIQNSSIAGTYLINAYTSMQNAPIPADVRSKPLYYYQYRKQLLEATEPMKNQAKKYFLSMAQQLDSLKLPAENGAKCRDEYREISFTIAHEYDTLANEILHNPELPPGMSAEQKEDLTFNLEDIGLELQDKAVQRYEDALSSLKQFAADNSNYPGKIMQALARLKPEKYGKSFFKPITVLTGTDWFARSDSIAGWNTQQVPITGWNPVSTMPPPAQSVKFPAGFAPDYVWDATNSSNRILLWKHVFIAGVPRNAVIYMAHTGQYQLYINGTLTAGDTTGIYTKGVCDSLAGMAKLFKGGDNDIAVYVRTEDSLSRGIALAFSFLIDTTEHFTPDPAYTQFSEYKPVRDEAVQPKPSVAPASVKNGTMHSQNASPVTGAMQNTAESKVSAPVVADTIPALHTDTLTSQKPAAPAVQKVAASSAAPVVADTISASHTDTLMSQKPAAPAVQQTTVPKTVPAVVDTLSAQHADTLETQKQPAGSNVNRQ